MNRPTAQERFHTAVGRRSVAWARVETCTSGEYDHAFAEYRKLAEEADAAWDAYLADCGEVRA